MLLRTTALEPTREGARLTPGWSADRGSDSALRAYTLMTVLILLPAHLVAPLAGNAQQAGKGPRRVTGTGGPTGRPS